MLSHAIMTQTPSPDCALSQGSSTITMLKISSLAPQLCNAHMHSHVTRIAAAQAKAAIASTCAAQAVTPCLIVYTLRSHLADCVHLHW